MGSNSDRAFNPGDRVDCYLGTRMRKPFGTGQVTGVSPTCERWILVRDDITGQTHAWDQSCLETPSTRTNANHGE